MASRRILVTSALPYANGHIHIGHLVEYLQTDMWVRFQKLRGHECRYFCADDTHGTSIMIRARQEGRAETDVIAEMSESHQRDFAGFHIEFDHYGSTNSEANKERCTEVWKALRDQDLVIERDVTQLFDPKEGIFLADRFVKGICPNCATPEQYGDSCEKCLATYSPTDLKDPKSTLSGATPEVRTAKHLFVTIESFRSFLSEWTGQDDHLESSVANYLKGQFLGKELRDWDISRPAPYFGFEIPDAPGHYWYVWFDAPIGYIASTQEWCAKHNQNLDDWWRSDQTEIHHFIGKDITYFHALFWPSMLKAAGFTLPTRVQVHGFLTVNGEKMSKSKGTFIRASTYLEHLNPTYLRYFYASKLTPREDDIDLNLEEFAQKVNSELVNKVVNLASRSARFVADTGLSDAYPDDGGLFEAAAAAGETIAAAYEGKDYNKAVRLIVGLADRANEYFDKMAPWQLKKEGKLDAARDVCSVALNLFRQLTIYLAPVVPQLSTQSARLLGTEIKSWDDAKAPLTGTAVQPFKHLLTRVDMKDVQAVIDASTDASAETASATTAVAKDSGDALAAEPLADECTFDDFMRVDLRVARVLKAETIPEARKLLKLTLGLGGDETRTVFAGIKSAYEPGALEGRLVVVVANLAPRKMKFGVSEGMVIAAGPGKSDIFVLSPDDGAVPGQRVH